ncbi:hypothetical protein MMC12_004997 [Toensbergia leucococca]|nr:hypothetical protein [Toensbergia leucococca]
MEPGAPRTSKFHLNTLPNLSPTDFATSWTNKPFILTDPVREWPVYRDWSTESLLRKYSNVKFRAEAVDWPLKTYVEYMHNNQDESPLYLFDRSFAEKMNLQVGKAHTGHYWPPSCFGEDLFAVLGPQRPDSRWLIIGPERSGSTFHKDPNATSAWNAIIFGAKYWIAFPPSTSPPGVFVSPDQSEVTSPLSIPEWLLGFHAQARLTPGCKEGICYAGEVLHVPSGWWHLVVNLSASIAVTQNFVPRRHLGHVMAFLRDKREQVSGFASGFEDPYGLFLGRMGEVFPGVVEEAVGEMERAGVGRKRKWEELVKGGEESELGGGGGFSFGFGGEDEDEVP